MLFFFSYKTITYDYAIGGVVCDGISEDIYCHVEIDMERLMTINPSLHAWISKLNHGNTVNVIGTGSDDDAEMMYDTIIKDACSGETGCIKPVAVKSINIYAKRNKARADVKMMISHIPK